MPWNTHVKHHFIEIMFLCSLTWAYVNSYESLLIVWVESFGLELLHGFKAINKSLIIIIIIEVQVGSYILEE